MALLSHADALAFLMSEDEVPAARQWAEFHHLDLTWDEADLRVTLRLSSHPDVGEPEPYLIEGKCQEYRVIPPSWQFLDPRTGLDVGDAGTPLAGAFPGGSVLHSSGVICAPWNRLAYADQRAVHSDWTEPSKWQSIAPGHTNASTLPEMLARIRAEVLISPGRRAPLPDLADRS